MKKFFVSLMALILGTTGYAVVDKTIENRVETLEGQVSELQEDVSVLESKLDNFSGKEETKHELVGTKIETPLETYNYKRYGYVKQEFDADSERVENELTIHSLKATIVEVDEYKTPDIIDDIKDLESYPTRYTVRIECNYTSKVNGDYYYSIYNDDWGDSENRSQKDYFTIRFYIDNTAIYPISKDDKPSVSMKLASNYSGTFATEFKTTSLEPIQSVCIEGFHETIDSEIPIV